MPETGFSFSIYRRTTLLKQRADAAAGADVKAGRVVPHERVREWLGLNRARRGRGG